MTTTTKTTAKINRDILEVDNAKDDIIIVNALADIPCGRTLETSEWQGGDIIPAGTVIATDADGKFHTLPTKEGNKNEYDLMKMNGHEYSVRNDDDTADVPKTVAGQFTPVGILKRSILKERPFAAIVTAGQVNAKAVKIPYPKEVRESLKLINFLYTND